MITILIIEDDPSVRDNLADILTLEEFRVITASDGWEGLEAAIEHQPALIICDVMMPELDGYAVVKAVRKQAEICNTPFIFLTAKADRMEQREGMELGADDYLTKPFRPSEVIRAVKVRLERHAATMQPYQDERVRSHSLEEQLKSNAELSEIKDNLLTKLSQDLREPLANVNLALHMLGNAQTDADRDRYINILKQEYNREMRLLREAANLQDLITPNNIQVLRQFNLFRDNS